ncbi:hypothetical protein H8A99_12075, partial [Bradyrhizobium sp. Arg68]|nr:hypothetical protein [Bradyrhizobium ivorense]
MFRYHPPGGASALVLGAALCAIPSMIPSWAKAQSTALPPVTVEAPQAARAKP